MIKLHLLLHVVTLCFTYADDDDGLQTGAEGGRVSFLFFFYLQTGPLHLSEDKKKQKKNELDLIKI